MGIVTMAFLLASIVDEFPSPLSVVNLASCYGNQKKLLNELLTQQKEKGTGCTQKPPGSEAVRLGEAVNMGLVIKNHLKEGFWLTCTQKGWDWGNKRDERMLQL